LLAAAAPDEIAVVALDTSPAVLAAVGHVATERQAEGSVVQSQESLVVRLTGMPQHEQPDEKALRQMLADARHLEAHFDGHGATELHQKIVRAFDLAIQPSAAVRVLAGKAGLDMASVLLTEGQQEAAARVAQETWRRFGNTPIDTVRYAPPTVQFLESQRRAVASHPDVQLTVISSRPGVLFADGTQLGEVHGRLSVRLPRGRYRLWLEWREGMSLPHPVELDATPIAVTIDAGLEQQIDVVRALVVRCQQNCSAVLGALGRRVEVARVIGVGATVPDANRESNSQRFRLIEVDAHTGKTSESVIGLHGGRVEESVRAEKAEEPMAPFSPLYLIPFGGGQLAQERPYFALGNLSVQLGLLAWYGWVQHNGSRAREVGALLRERQLGQQQDLAIGLLVAAVAAGIVEAVVVGFLSE
jgi:hypothetical protein